MLTACAAGTTAAPQCRVVLEQSDAFEADSYTAAVPAGQAVRFVLTVADGYTLTGADYPGAVLAADAGGRYTLTLPGVSYSTAVAVTAQRSDSCFYYHANGGQRLDGGDAQGWVEVAVTASHLRLNTAQGNDLFTRDGCTLTGWNTAADGSGEAVGLGSRTAPGARLYAQWAAWNDEAEFTYRIENGAAVITGWSGGSARLVVPAELGGAPVVSIEGGAFADAPCTEVILPATLRHLQPGAFAGAAVQSVTLSDSIQTVSDYAFTGCTALRTLHLNAAEAPVYSGGYYSTWADKYDRLLALRGQKKLVLFSGSSTRFGYDSAALEQALPAYSVVNMGVFAYTNAVPQLLLILGHMQAGDILLVSPEFDAAKRQFCTSNVMDDDFFCMMEANYDMLAELDLREVEGTFSALGSYLQTKSTLTPRSYALDPAAYDEDGSPTETPSYNLYGDYILYRPDAADDQPIYGLPVEYTVEAFPAELYLTPANAMFRRFTGSGIAVYLTYSPRNRLAVSASSTAESIEALDEWLRAGLEIPVITRLSDSLMPGRYFYGTDNHLSTNGVALRTAQVISGLQAQMEKEGLL